MRISRALVENVVLEDVTEAGARATIERNCCLRPGTGTQRAGAPERLRPHPRVAVAVLKECVVIHAVVGAAVPPGTWHPTPTVFEHEARVHRGVKEVVPDNVLRSSKRKIICSVIRVVHAS